MLEPLSIMGERSATRTFRPLPGAGLEMEVLPTFRSENQSKFLRQVQLPGVRWPVLGMEREAGFPQTDCGSMTTAHLIGYLFAAKPGWARAIVIFAAELPMLHAWFKSEAQSPLRNTVHAGYRGPRGWALSDVLFVSSMALLFYFWMHDFHFSRRDQLSLCALIIGIAGLLRTCDF